MLRIENKVAVGVKRAHELDGRVVKKEIYLKKSLPSTTVPFGIKGWSCHLEDTNQQHERGKAADEGGRLPEETRLLRRCHQVFLFFYFLLNMFSTVAALACIIVIPGLYTYLQHIQSSVQIDVSSFSFNKSTILKANFCKHRADGLFSLYSQVQASRGLKVVAKRQAYDSPAHAHTGTPAASAYDAPSGNNNSKTNCFVFQAT